MAAGQFRNETGWESSNTFPPPTTRVVWCLCVGVAARQQSDSWPPPPAPTDFAVVSFDPLLTATAASDGEWRQCGFVVGRSKI